MPDETEEPGDAHPTLALPLLSAYLTEEVCAKPIIKDNPTEETEGEGRGQKGRFHAAYERATHRIGF